MCHIVPPEKRLQAICRGQGTKAVTGCRNANHPQSFLIPAELTGASPSRGVVLLRKVKELGGESVLGLQLHALTEEPRPSRVRVDRSD